MKLLPADRKRAIPSLCFEESRSFAKEIACLLESSASYVSRKLNRNSGLRGYWPQQDELLTVG